MARLKKSPEEVKASKRDSHLRRTYGITFEQYQELLKKQNGSCGVCKREQSQFKTALAVDHDHVTGEVRGLLCTHCNRRVIGRHRDPDLFLSAYKYLLGHTGWFVPTKKKRKKNGKKVSNRPRSTRSSRLQ